VLAEDPHDRRGAHQIKKLARQGSGERQWRIRWRQLSIAAWPCRGWGGAALVSTSEGSLLSRTKP